MLTARQRHLRARIAALTRVSSAGYDGAAATATATRTYWQRYHDQVNPTGSLSPEETERRAKAAWQADMARARLAKSKRRKK